MHYVIRPIEPGDKEALVEGLRRLSDESIRRRFLTSEPRFTQPELRYLTEVDGRNHIALVAEVDGELAAVARCVGLPDRPDTAEMAIVVGDPFQGQGLGRALTLALADATLAVGMRRFAATMLGDNEAARRLMRTFSRRLEETRAEDGLRETIVEITA